MRKSPQAYHTKVQDTADPDPVNLGHANHTPLDDAPMIALGSGLTGRYGLCPVGALLDNPHTVRIHSKRQLKKIGRAMLVAGPLAPLVIDEAYTLLAGHGRLAAAKDNGETAVPVVQVFGLSEARKRLFLLSDDEVGRGAGLDAASSLNSCRS